jgi:hypothetical protein
MSLLVKRRSVGEMGLGGEGPVGPVLIFKDDDGGFAVKGDRYFAEKSNFTGEMLYEELLSAVLVRSVIPVCMADGYRGGEKQQKKMKDHDSCRGLSLRFRCGFHNFIS